MGKDKAFAFEEEGQENNDDVVIKTYAEYFLPRCRINKAYSLQHYQNSDEAIEAFVGTLDELAEHYDCGEDK
ncbi:unnamed protein product [Caretta caretta]